MDNARLLIVAMATRCKNVIFTHTTSTIELPRPLQSKHLLWMCENIESKADNWPVAKSHRWLGFVQCAMIANEMIDLNGAKAMFDDAKVAYGDSSEDFMDHLDPASSFELDLGGEG